MGKGIDSYLKEQLQNIPKPEMVHNQPIRENKNVPIIKKKRLKKERTHKIELSEEEQLLKEIDDDMLWFDLTHLLNEPQEREAPEIHITIDYTVRAFEETEKEYLELYSFFTH